MDSIKYSTNIDINSIKHTIQSQQSYFYTGITRPISYRKEMLKKLRSGLEYYENEFIDALQKDFQKPVFETYATEIAQLYKELSFAIANVGTWSERKRVSSVLVSFPSKHFIYPEPYGTVYIIGAWNYPLLLTMLPLIGAMTAGNCVVLKPSELAWNTSNLINRMFSEIFEEKYIKVYEGGAEVNKLLLEQQFDYIFFTGSSSVGKIVMKAAAEKLIPITLELGGKSPCIVDEDADPYVSASRVIFGKFLNAGQTCIAPDYLYVHKNIKEDFIKAFKAILEKRYGNNAKLSDDYARIINKKHFERLNNYLLKGNILVGGETDVEEYYIAPTLIDNISWEDGIMKGEIFGPILPLLVFDNFDDLLDILKEREKPLAAYYFSGNKNKQERFINAFNFGGGCINDTIFHFGNPHLPIGGVGNSGIGRYHGKYSFDTFSNFKSIVKKPFALDVNLRYPPYKGKLKWIKLLFKI